MKRVYRVHTKLLAFGKELEQEEQDEIDNRELEEEDLRHRLVMLANQMKQIGLVIVGLHCATTNYSIADLHSRRSCRRRVEFLLARVVWIHVEVDIVVADDNAYVD